AVIIAVIGAALLVLDQRAADLPVSDLGAIVGPVDGEWWRYVAAPFVYPDVGYLFVTSVAIVIFGSGVERRLGTISTLVLMLACGALGMLAADGIESVLAGEGNLLLAAGGNGVALGLLAAWSTLRSRELREQPEDDVDIIGVAAIAVVLIMLPLVEDFANVFAGLGGALVGGVCGSAAAYARREKGNRDPDDSDDLAA
ncbi:MAG: rhomboid family intramembrane serine protease, partial [Actinomycetota bacterium]|nr:rhomboid family intramembrane serine protease [Actinomycetota bacterium]